MTVVHHKTKGQTYTFDDSYFESIDTQSKAYILGFIAADGYVCRDGRGFIIKLHRKDRALLEQIGEEITGTNAFVKDSPPTYDRVYSVLHIPCKKMNADLRSKGLLPNKSYALTSESYYHVPDSLRRHYLRGYFDGDGHVRFGVKYGQSRYYTVKIIGTKEFLENTYCKDFPTVNKVREIVCKGGSLYDYYITSKDGVSSFLKYIYEESVIHLERKYEVYCGHVKPCELSGNPNEKDEGNQQPSNG